MQVLSLLIDFAIPLLCSRTACFV